MIERFRIWLTVRVLWFYTLLVGLTSRIVWIGREHAQRLRAQKQSAIYTFWHGRQAMLLYCHWSEAIAVLISPSKDGELVSRLASCYKIPSVRGSSRKKPAQGLRGLIREVRAGRCIAITPDGPIGPAEEIKEGVVYLAQTLGIPILPLASSFSRKAVLKSWDRFLFPFPFNKIIVAYDEPFWIKSNDNPEDKTKELKLILDRLTRKTDDLAARV
ncbi:MAG: lysophospholipid acyltransferase family protein [Elusimicrobia bacterium]|nr:lysophospholipid acyltransferase family protein [Elusimicrobiota bacterium]